MDLIRDEEPSRPSTRLSQSGDKITGISQLRQIDSRRLSLILKGELDWIAIKALEKDRTRRYDGAGALADDVQRYLNQEAILARPPSVGYRLNKTIRKHKAAFASGTAILVLLIAGLIGTGTMWSRASVAEREAREAEEQAKKNLDISLRREGQSQAAVDFLVNAFRNPDTTLDGREAKVVDMLQNALSDLQGQTELTPLNRAPLLQALGQTFDGLGMFEQALAATKQAYELRKENLGENHDDTLHTKVRLGIAFLQAGDSDTAFELLEESLAKRRAKYGNEDPPTLDLINTLAVAYRVAGDPNKALPLFKEALERRQAVLGAEHLLTLDSLHILAHFYFEISQPAKTIPLLREILAIKRKKFGENNLDTLAVLNKLAASYARTGDLAKTKETLRESIQLRREHFPDHWETYDTIAYFGAVMAMFELHEEAEPLLLEGIQGLQARLKTDPVFKLSVIESPLQSLIDSYKKLNKPEEAAKWQAALEKMRVELGSQSPQPKSNSATAPEKQPST